MNVTDEPATPVPCNISLPRIAGDLTCTHTAGHTGPHQHGTRTWDTDTSIRIHGLIDAAETKITNEARRLAREAVLTGTVSLQVQGIENRTARRAEGRGLKDARKRRR